MRYKKLSIKDQKIYRSLIIIYHNEFFVLENLKAFQKDIDILVENDMLIQGKVEIGDLSGLVERLSGDNRKKKKRKPLKNQIVDHIRWTPKGNYYLKKYGIY